MSNSTPTIRTTDKDGEGPAKRVRRPALSCVECRVRKVKCDRQKPCGACRRTGSATCTYRSRRDGISAHARSPAAASSGSNDHDRDIDNQARPYPHTGRSNELDVYLNRYVAPGIFGEHGRIFMQRLPPKQTLNLESGSRTGELAVIESLLERIRNLESREAARARGEDISNLPASGLADEEPGQFIKAKYYGTSHWMNALDPYDALGKANITVNPNTNRKEVNKKTELYTTVMKIKTMARIIKTSRLLQPSLPQEVLESIPTKEICDQLIDCYFRTFEGVFRVLHVPSFLAEYESYWTSNGSPRLSVILKILLVCAIGATFYDGPNQADLRTKAIQWTQAASAWLNGPHLKSKLNMAGLQISILILIGRQVCNTDGDHTWIPAGSLLRTAMHLGLHRDPAHFSKISPFHREMRRRLWATILEITAQSSLDMGMPPMISVNDYDTKPPSNINDEDMGEGNDTPFEERPPGEFTDCSIQIAFTQTLPVRLEIIRLINNLRFDLSYETVLETGKKLIHACDEQTAFLKSALNTTRNLTPFHIKLADSLVRRFILCLHRPYFGKAKDNPQYYFSRKICLDTSLAILAHATVLGPEQEDDWTRMTQRCVGFFKSLALYAMSTVYLELNSQIEEQAQVSSIFTPMVSDNTSNTPNPQITSLPLQFHALRDVLVWAHNMTLARLRNGETNAKGATFLACALARIDALISGQDPEAAVLAAAKKSVAEASRILADVYQAEHGVPINLHISNLSKEAERGEGADDITGRHLPTGSAVSREAGAPLRSDVDAPISQGFVGVSGSVQGGLPSFDMLDSGLGSLSGNMDIDFNSGGYLGGNGMEMANGYHFGRSPEWFYELSGWATAGGWGNDIVNT